MALAHDTGVKNRDIVPACSAPGGKRHGCT